MTTKSIDEILAEEKQKLLAEVNEKVRKKKVLMSSDEPETGFQNLSRKY